MNYLFTPATDDDLSRKLKEVNDRSSGRGSGKNG